MQIIRKYATTVRAFSLSLTLFPKCCFHFLTFIPTKDPTSVCGMARVVDAASEVSCSLLLRHDNTASAIKRVEDTFTKLTYEYKITNCFLTVTSHPVFVPLYFHTDWDRFWSFPHFFTLNKEHISLRWFSSIYKYKQFSVPRDGINSRISLQCFQTGTVEKINYCHTA